MYVEEVAGFGRAQWCWDDRSETPRPALFIFVDSACGGVGWKPRPGPARGGVATTVHIALSLSHSCPHAHPRVACLMSSPNPGPFTPSVTFPCPLPTLHTAVQVGATAAPERRPPKVRGHGVCSTRSPALVSMFCPSLWVQHPLSTCGAVATWLTVTVG